jgi:outer membrane protein, heavy metal efflux system
MRFRTAVSVFCIACAASAASSGAQAPPPLSRAAAIQGALERGARIAVAAADTSVASAALIAARARPNPSLTASYSKSLPNYHAAVDIPIDYPMLRQLRIRSAQSGVQAAQLRFAFNRAMLVMEVDTAYTRAVAARERVVLSRRNALDADSLLHMVERRRDAGDASDMDVEIARVNAGQQQNLAAADSLTMTSAYLDLQATLGAASDRLEVVPSDSLTTPPDALAPASTSLNESAANLSLEAAALNARLQRRSIWSQFSLSVGTEWGDPDQHGLLPTFGIGIGLPFFDRNRGPIAQAEAERLRAQAELAAVRVEDRNALLHAQRARQSAMARLVRDRALIASANTVSRMALTAYREGASSLADVLAAQRSARDVLGQYIDDLAAAWIATAELRVFSLTSTSPLP